jgi:Asp-tRNA(Asn)/Glu-tRNA(Gln) amidotransferase A subunit family amidase
VSTEGQKFYSLLLDTLGWYGRSVQDLSLLADVFNLHDDEASTFKSVRGVKIAVCRTDNWCHAGEGTKAALEKAKTLLQAHGAVLEEVALPPSFADIPEWHRVLLATDGKAGFLPEHRVAKDKLHVSLSTYIDLKDFTHKQQLAAQDGIAALRPEFDRIAAAYDAVLTASVVDEAPEGLEFTGDAVFCAMWTVRTYARSSCFHCKVSAGVSACPSSRRDVQQHVVHCRAPTLQCSYWAKGGIHTDSLAIAQALHVPVVNLPGFQGATGMPIGVSLIAPRFRDRHLLTVAEAVGKIFEAEGGWKRNVKCSPPTGFATSLNYPRECQVGQRIPLVKRRLFAM